MKTMTLKLIGVISGAFVAAGLSMLFVADSDAGSRAGPPLRGASLQVGASLGAVTCGDFNFPGRFDNKVVDDQCDGCVKDTRSGVNQHPTLKTNGKQENPVDCGKQMSGKVKVTKGVVTCLQVTVLDQACNKPNVLATQQGK